MPKRFVPNNFDVPKILETTRVKIRPLTEKDAEKDYAAVMSSVDYLRKNSNPPCCAGWPTKELTLQRDKEDLRWHEAKHKAREAFTYTIMTPHEKKCWGCIYFFPSEKKDCDADVYFWVTKQQSKRGLDKYLFNLLKKWVREEWIFKSARFPGRCLELS